MEEKIYLTKKEVAKYLRISAATVNRMLAANRIPAFRLGARDWRFEQGEIDDWIASLPRLMATSTN